MTIISLLILVSHRFSGSSHGRGCQPTVECGGFVDIHIGSAWRGCGACLDAYKLMKEGKSKRGNMSMDHYTRKLKGDSEISHVIQHSTKTLYMNVIVKNSLKVVNNELERLAKIKWADDQSTKSGETDIERQRFEQFRAAAQVNLVKLAGLALASDFTPRRIAIQLSNDFYRLLTPKLKKRGVSIETEIEYRVGPYFVLAINFGKIDWRRLVKSANRDVAERRSRWERDRDTEDTEKASQRARNLVSLFLFGSRDEVLAQFLALLYYFHWIFYTPICFVLYHVFLGQTFRSYFLSSVADGKSARARIKSLCIFFRTTTHFVFAQKKSFSTLNRKEWKWK